MSILPFQTLGYEDMELSTQIVIGEALRRGLGVEILDRSEHFIRISNGQRQECIREATKTSVDSYITSLILENKFVAKKLMEESGIKVPKAFHYINCEDAFKAYKNVFCKGQWVVKPKSTNFGIGVSMLEENVSEEDFRDAVEKAFENGNILVEEFIAGPEYRFLIMGDQCVAVLNRVPANVIGDGEHSIKDLVEKKNSDSRRGEGYKTPLEFIQLGVVELAELKHGELVPESVVEVGRKVFLRRNSNISTGGDSIDVTDIVHEFYKKAAVEAAQSVNAKMCGVDMIVPNFKKEGHYGVIEVNFNPVLYFHNFPYEGENRDTGRFLLDLLGF